MKILVLYVFHIYNFRVKYFIEHAIFKSPNVDFLVIENKQPGSKKSLLDLPKHVDYLNRENIGYDFGAWSYGLQHNSNYKKYDRYIFVNSSVLGPFLKASEPIQNWVYHYINLLDAEVKLVGSTINSMIGTNQMSHVQSYIFCMSSETLAFLMSKHIFSLRNMAKTFDEAIDKEIMMSRHIIDNGWNIACLHKLYKGVDFRNIKKKNKNIMMDDIMYPDYIYSQPKSIFKELVFVKGNRL